MVKTFTTSSIPVQSVWHHLQPIFCLICVEVHPLPPTPTLLVYPHIQFRSLYSTSMYFCHISVTSLSSVTTFPRLPFMAPHPGSTRDVYNLLELVYRSPRLVTLFYLSVFLKSAHLFVLPCSPLEGFIQSSIFTIVFLISGLSWFNCD